MSAVYGPPISPPDHYEQCELRDEGWYWCDECCGVFSETDFGVTRNICPDCGKFSRRYDECICDLLRERWLDSLDY